MIKSGLEDKGEGIPAGWPETHIATIDRQTRADILARQAIDNGIYPFDVSVTMPSGKEVRTNIIRSEEDIVILETQGEAYVRIGEEMLALAKASRERIKDSYSVVSTVTSVDPDPRYAIGSVGDDLIFER